MFEHFLQLSERLASLAPQLTSDPRQVNSPDWSIAVTTVVNQGLKRPRITASDLVNTPLASAEDTAQAAIPDLTTTLTQLDLSGKSAGSLRRLAQWWLEQASSVTPQWESLPNEDLRQVLGMIPGMTRGLQDALLLWTFGRDEVPRDRGVERIAFRHGWTEPDVGLEEWQAYFRRGCEETSLSLPALMQGLQQVGREYCGARPNCDACPLQSLLPASGPREWDG